jgi:deoxyribodipyrimidine photo-lyase
LNSLRSREKLVAPLPIDHSVLRAQYPGGAAAARVRLKSFLSGRLKRYGGDRNEAERDGSSGLSPYLHFGHISVHEIFVELMREQEWSVDAMEPVKPTGKRHGWWRGLSESAEDFLDQLITWRELGFNFCLPQRLRSV